MDEIIEAITDELIKSLQSLESHTYDETGCRNPDKYDDRTKQLRTKITKLRKLRYDTEAIICSSTEQEDD